MNLKTVLFAGGLYCCGFAAAQSITLTASVNELAPDQEATIIVAVDTSGQEARAIAAVIDFDPAVVEIVRLESDPSKPEVRRESTSPFVISPGALLQSDSQLAIPFLPIDGLDFPVAYTGNLATFRVRGVAPGGAMISFGAGTQVTTGTGSILDPLEREGVEITVAAVTQICTLSVSGGSPSIPVGGGTTVPFSVDVAADTCAWTVSTSLGSTSVPGATGDGSFTVSVPANTGSGARSIVVVIAPEGNAAGAVELTITQAAPAPTICTLSVSGGSGSVPAGGGITAAFNVDVTEDTCGWTVSSSLGTTSVAGGTGDGAFTVNVPPNTGGGARTITVIITPEDNNGGAVTRTVSQAAPGQPDCFPLTLTDAFATTAENCAGGYTAGTVVNISANQAPQGQFFAFWGGGGSSSVADVFSPNTTVTMDGARDVRAIFLLDDGDTLGLFLDSIGTDSTHFATNASGFGGYSTSCGSGDFNAVHFSWVPTVSGLAEIAVCDSVTFDTTLAVFVRDGDSLVEIACNDDFCGIGSIVQLDVFAFTEYFIRVAGINGATGEFLLEVSMPSDSDVMSVEDAVELRNRFEEADTNGDSVINFDEVLAILPSASDSAFQSVDSDGDGFITRDELNFYIDGKPDASACHASGSGVASGTPYSDLTLMALLVAALLFGARRRPALVG